MRTAKYEPPAIGREVRVAGRGTVIWGCPILECLEPMLREKTLKTLWKIWKTSEIVARTIQIL